jgi:hypothetical protein
MPQHHAHYLRARAHAAADVEIKGFRIMQQVQPCSLHNKVGQHKIQKPGQKLRRELIEDSVSFTLHNQQVQHLKRRRVQDLQIVTFMYRIFI